MKVDVSFQSEDELKQLQPAPAIVITEVVKGSRMTGLSSRIKGGLGNIKKIFKKGSGPSKQSAFKPVNATTLEGREPVPTAVGSESTTVSSAERKLKKKHKKHR
jgi:hypothetical protein